MARTDNDSWDLTSSVGATATAVAAGRALATKDPRRLVDDPFADPLVRAVGIEFFVKLIDGDVDTSAFGELAPERMQSMINGMGVRAKFFDDYFAAATATGIRQAVILASGLDARAYRLPWPSGTTVFEIDQPDVIEFKTGVLAGIGAEPAAQHRTVGIDLREDWPAALRAAGFDPSVPTAWVAEGLLVYLPPEAQDRLFDTITELSAPGSMVATEFVPSIMDFDPEKGTAMTAQAREQGLDIDMGSLVYAGPRSHVISYLGEKGWDVTGIPSDELFARNGVPAPSERGDNDPFGEIVYVSATLG
ncbi:class I SAM-dependent methyltransferase [Mycolicibacterium pallens]|uniref:S-adenosyl-L-methionine-dependent methyltransferase n=1 Tax=Mycolicibacterium pallens TaxID=370524 RepID=A0ABX8VJJ0_9MYCO|nr:class I SAM-dependent methyltransferase [Mycolicibacterium pallens]APE16578.1 SAM-dependent methyltransferase [Mycobacterium sp. WY10]QYL17970.1 class I SAM-dependent methyltransferase [Mycolicibacterium pallens]